ncbi:hypothetical protein XENORESO_015635 [Xenotaenia resolanae]|uniref:Uncharacterized protein n=1 Tax=Xenotaenia resolanae TaxID=208358 RepID=A0ABV0WKU1_9TELE
MQKAGQHLGIPSFHVNKNQSHFLQASWLDENNFNFKAALYMNNFSHVGTVSIDILYRIIFVVSKRPASISKSQESYTQPSCYLLNVLLSLAASRSINMPHCVEGILFLNSFLFHCASTDLISN